MLPKIFTSALNGDIPSNLFIIGNIENSIFSVLQKFKYNSNGKVEGDIEELTKLLVEILKNTQNEDI